ncbi:MAG: branched-chain amino acid aminotransferase/4-amino-4-deoxychorismate lyase [Actinomycetia bacterium]|nr:branched-chain amino acid aminotransferase/4-amino-4-deoxychorismate lyase [Actinomycetes bacterium]
MMVWLDGSLLEVRQARVSPLDHGVTVGDGVFETLRAYAGVPFAWSRHAERLARSARALGLPEPDGDELRAAVEDVLSVNGLDDARVRVTFTGGPAPLGSERGHDSPTRMVVAGRFTPWPPTARVAMAPWTRNERGALVGLKTTSYAENVRALAFAHERGADEALLANNRGELCEGTGSNVFVVADGALRTPPLDAGCLAGITRALVLELAADAGIAVEETALPADALDAADEAFITSSTREVHAIAAVDDRPLAAPGPVTAKLAAAFSDLVATTPDP